MAAVTRSNATPRGASPRIVMTLLVRDEEDILAANLDFHLAQGVDHVIVMDHLSRDGSREVVERYCRAGVAELIVQHDPGYRQSMWVTMMARKAAHHYGADWVINCDADEFWWPRDGDLRTSLHAIAPDIGCAHASRHNFPPVDDGHGHFLDRMTYRDTASVNALGKPLPGKACHRGHAEVVVHAGNHSASVPGLPRSSETSAIEVLHFPARALEHYVRKIASGSCAIGLASDFKGGATWRTLAASPDGARCHYDAICLKAADIPALLDSGRIVRDTRLRDFMRARRLAGLGGDATGSS